MIKRILIIDDEPFHVSAIRRLLHQDGFEVLSATDGETGLEIARVHKPDLILLDILMPKLDGIEVCRLIRQDPEIDLIKIVFVSGRVTTAERIAGYKAGADDYITKPYDHEELLAKIQTLLRLKREEEISRAKSNLLSLFSHETRTPLSGIVGAGNLLCEEDNLSDEQRSLAQIIVQSGERLLDFVDKVALLTQLKSGYIRRDSTGEFGMHAKMAVDRWRVAAEKRGVQVVATHNTVVEMAADWQLIDIVLDGLLSNAIRFSPDGTTITTTSLVGPRHVEFVIADQGPGISPDRRASVFDEFSVHDIMHHSKGQGLSLAIARQVISLHNGEIQVEDTDGGGAVFKLILPTHTVDKNRFEHRLKNGTSRQRLLE